MYLLPWLMPYAVFICLVGVMTAIVNTRRVFFLASLNALILNVIMILLLAAAQAFSGNSDGKLLYILTGGVLVSGVLQVLMLGWLLKRCGVFPIFKKSEQSSRSILKELYQLTLPGMIGGGAMQVSFLIFILCIPFLKQHSDFKSQLKLAGSVVFDHFSA
jgi:putative peptidoglycan lipid II flippase